MAGRAGAAVAATASLDAHGQEEERGKAGDHTLLWSDSKLSLQRSTQTRASRYSTARMDAPRRSF